MKKCTVLLSAALLMAMPALAQHGPTTPRANEGHVPPAPTARANRPAAGTGTGTGYAAATQGRTDGERLVSGRTNDTQHVNHDTWYSHDAPSDPRYKIDQPFAHGHFAAFGADHRYGISRIDAAHHYFYLPGGAYFMVADWDWATFADWCYDCGEDFVVYEDPDHAGWYLLYDGNTGLYIHVQYMGM